MQPQSSRGNGRTPPDEALRSIRMLDTERSRALASAALAAIAAASADPQTRACLAFELICRARRAVALHDGRRREELGAQANVARSLCEAAARGDLEATFWQWWDDMARRAARERHPAHPAVDRARQYIQKHYSHKLTLTDIARVAAVSRNYLSHLFRRHCGVTVVGFIHRARIKQAVKLMRRSNVKVTVVARRVGYSTYRDFHRNFVRLHHTPPRRFRMSRPAEAPGPATGSGAGQNLAAQRRPALRRQE